jgi:hypothetical protein
MARLTAYPIEGTNLMNNLPTWLILALLVIAALIVVYPVLLHGLARPIEWITAAGRGERS